MRLIDADALLNSGFPTIYHTEFGDEVVNTDDIRNAPTVELQMGRMTNGIIIPIERPTGEWKLDDTEQFCYCSNCEDTFYPRPLDPSWYYCPHCGAKMKGGAEE